MSRTPSTATITQVQQRTPPSVARSPVDTHASPPGPRRFSRETAARRPSGLSPRQPKLSSEKAAAPPSAVASSSSGSSSSSESETALHPMVRSRAFARRPRYSSGKPPAPSHPLSDADEDDDEDSPPFLPFSANPATNTLIPPASPVSREHQTSGSNNKPSQFTQRLASHRLAPSSPIAAAINVSTVPASTLPASSSRRQQQQQLRQALTTQQPQSSSSSSHSQSPLPQQQHQRANTGANNQKRSAATSSPRSRRAAELTNEGGNREQRGVATSSSLSPSTVGSSFSDLDDDEYTASVTRSALEEALANEMTHGGGSGGGVASRMSTISQALRSRYL